MYRVDWIRIALDALMEIWMAADDRNAITEAVERIDRELALDPSHAGESRPNDQRVTYALPLGVRFEVIESERRVVVVAVWRVRRRGRSSQG